MLYSRLRMQSQSRKLVLSFAYGVYTYIVSSRVELCMKSRGKSSGTSMIRTSAKFTSAKGVFKNAASDCRFVGITKCCQDLLYDFYFGEEPMAIGLEAQLQRTKTLRRRKRKEISQDNRMSRYAEGPRRPYVSVQAILVGRQTARLLNIDFYCVDTRASYIVESLN